MITLFDYQQKIVEDALAKERAVYWCATGLGKTICILQLVKLNYHKGKHLIITKAGLIKSAFEKDHARFYANDFPIHGGNVTVTSYEFFTLHQKEFKQTYWQSVYLDEIHAIGNRGSNNSHAILGDWKRRGQIMSRHYFGFTGTLVPNRPEQVFPMLRFAGYECTWTAFSGYFMVTPNPSIPQFKKMIPAKMPELHELIKKYIYHVTKDDVKDEVRRIKKNFYYYPFDLEPIQREAHEGLKHDGVWRDVLLDYNITKAMKLRQIVSGFLMTDKNDPTAIIELENPRSYVYDAVLKIISEQRHAITFYCFRRDEATLTKAVVDAGRPFYLINGTVSKARREKIIQAWRDRGGMLVMQIFVGKNGLTLVEARHMVFYNLLDNNEAYSQAQDRIERIGQQAEEVNYHVIYADKTVDEIIMKSLRDKEKVQTNIKKYLRGVR